MNIKWKSVARRGPSPRAEINVTPLVDVVLVLLIIFMVVTPFLRPIDVALPQAAHAEPSADLPVILTLRADGTLHLGDEALDPTDIPSRVEARAVLVRADGDLGFGVLRHIMEQLAVARVQGVDIATVPEESEESE